MRMGLIHLITYSVDRDKINHFMSMRTKVMRELAKNLIYRSAIGEDFQPQMQDITK